MFLQLITGGYWKTISPDNVQLKLLVLHRRFSCVRMRMRERESFRRINEYILFVRGQILKRSELLLRRENRDWVNEIIRS
jgi:hypothetical protein